MSPEEKLLRTKLIALYLATEPEIVVDITQSVDATLAALRASVLDECLARVGPYCKEKAPAGEEEGVRAIVREILEGVLAPQKGAGDGSG